VLFTAYLPIYGFIIYATLCCGVIAAAPFGLWLYKRVMAKRKNKVTNESDGEADYALKASSRPDKDDDDDDNVDAIEDTILLPDSTAKQPKRVSKSSYNYLLFKFQLFSLLAVVRTNFYILSSYYLTIQFFFQLLACLQSGISGFELFRMECKEQDYIYWCPEKPNPFANKVRSTHHLLCYLYINDGIRIQDANWWKDCCQLPLALLLESLTYYCI